MWRLRSLSINHRSATLAELEQAALSPSTLSWLDSRLAALRIQGVALTTCHRTELFWWGRSADQQAAGATVISEAIGGTLVERKAARFSGGAAAGHLFRVAAGLESAILGEAEILGQVRAAAERAERMGALGPELGMIFRAAVRFGRQARATTGIGAGTLSLASVAVRAVREVRPDLSGATVLVIGAGETSFRTARQLAAERVGRCVVFNRGAERAREVARATGAQAAPLAELSDYLAGADAVIAAVRVEHPILTAAALRAAHDPGRARPRVVVDLSLPRAVEPEARQVIGVRFHDLSELTEAVSRNLRARQAEIPRVETMLQDALERLSRALHRQRAPGSVVPIGRPARADD